MRIFQILQTLSYGDAISNEVLAIDNVLKQNGYITSIFAEFYRDKQIKKYVSPINNLVHILKDDDVVIYHLCIGTDITNLFKNFNCVKILIYHNITPEKYFSKYNKKMEEITKHGKQSLAYLADSVDYVIADSEYNKRELEILGYKNVIVMPILINFEAYKKTADKKIIKTYNDGKKNILFVGRLAPNKRQEDLILTFDYYKKYIDENSRLILVGSNAVPQYTNSIKDLIRKLKIEEVILSGHVTFEELLAYYNIADVFFCMSEHEGFCVPLLESMYFNVPIVALDATAIPDTLGNSGILFYHKDFARISELLDIVIKDVDIRKEIIEKQRKRLENLYKEAVENKILDILKMIEDN